MKTMKQSLSVALLLAMACVLLAGCQSAQTQYGVAHYNGIATQGQEGLDYNKELFYRNDKQTRLADPFVLDNTELDGYYYMYGTEGSLFCYRSQNLMDWESVGNTLDNMEYAADGSQTEFRRVTDTQMWAPEVV